MADGNYCPSEFFCASIAEFLDSTSVCENTEDGRELDQLFDHVPAELLQGDTTPLITPLPTWSIICLPGPSNAHELQHLKDKNRNINTDRSTNNWARRFETWQNQHDITLTLSEASAGELDEILHHFFAELKKMEQTMNQSHFTPC